MHWTCMYGHIKVVRMLLAEFASTEVTDDYRLTLVRPTSVLAEKCGQM